MGSTVIYEKDRKYVKVDWGRTMSLFGPENVGPKYLKINITEYAAGTAHTLHRHPRQEEVIYILEGKGIAKTDDGEQPIGPGAFVYVPENTDHATINVDKDRPMKAIIMKGPPDKE